MNQITSAAEYMEYLEIQVGMSVCFLMCTKYSVVFPAVRQCRLKLYNIDTEF